MNPPIRQTTQSNRGVNLDHEVGDRYCHGYPIPPQPMRHRLRTIRSPYSKVPSRVEHRNRMFDKRPDVGHRPDIRRLPDSTTGKQ